MSSSLTPFWVAWRKRRTKLLMADGFKKADAVRMASRETKDRASIARLIGNEAALDAEIIFELRPDGSFGQYAAVNPALVPAELMPRATAWANSGRQSVSTH